MFSRNSEFGSYTPTSLPYDLFSVAGNMKSTFSKQGLAMATYRVPLKVEVAGQHNVCSRDLHPLSFEDEVELIQL